MIGIYMNKTNIPTNWQKADAVTLKRIEWLHPNLREEVKSIYLNEVIPALSGSASCRFTYTLRTFAEQKQLYTQGRTTLFDSQGKRLGIVTNAKPGESFHNYGFAFDFVLLSGKAAVWDIVKDFDNDGIADWMEIVNIYKKHGYTWGGDFKSIKDYPHLEKTFGLTWKDCFKLYTLGQKDTDGYIILPT